MTQIPHSMVKGDTLTPLGATLKRNGAPFDVTGMDVQFKMVADNGTIKRDWTATGASIVDGDDGQVQYDFQAADVDTAGIFWGWFRVGTGGEWHTFPVAGEGGSARSLQIIINDTT